jgi:hypothetical protein
MTSLTAEQLDDLQSFIKDWLRHCGRSQSDLRRALRAASVRMPVLIEALHLTHSRGGTAALVEQLCGIEAQWHGEDQAAVLGGSLASGGALEQLDLLLQEIRQNQPEQA